ncbi:MAG TPA: GNAT family N-acetyltransferase [Micropepsaceae bacterium]|nr:GNAT family N-acetyltransferase [Micropepsaceae bacterium]
MRNSDAAHFAIARAGMEAVAETDALIREAADWLIAKGEPLWGPNETSYDELVRVARAGELVIGRVAADLAACMYLHHEDRLFWPQDLPGEAFYVHRLAVARKFAGRGYARMMLDWAETETRAKGRNYLRLDCEPRPKLLSLYRDAGFTRIDATPIRVGEHFVVRHEKRALQQRA